MIEELSIKIQDIFDNDNLYPEQMEASIFKAIMDAGYSYMIHDDYIIIGNGEKLLLAVDSKEEEVTLL